MSDKQNNKDQARALARIMALRNTFLSGALPVAPVPVRIVEEFHDALDWFAGDQIGDLRISEAELSPVRLGWFGGKQLCCDWSIFVSRLVAASYYCNLVWKESTNGDSSPAVAGFGQ